MFDVRFMIPTVQILRLRFFNGDVDEAWRRCSKMEDFW
jgi:hypothetical protein